MEQTLASTAYHLDSFHTEQLQWPTLTSLRPSTLHMRPARLDSKLSEPGLIRYTVATSPSVGYAGDDGGHSGDVGGCGGAADSRRGGRGGNDGSDGGDGVRSCGGGGAGGGSNSESAKGQTTHCSNMGARGHWPSHSASTRGRYNTGGHLHRRRGHHSGGPDSCWRTSKGAVGDAGVEGDEGATATRHCKVTLIVTLIVTPVVWCNALHSLL